MMMTDFYLMNMILKWLSLLQIRFIMRQNAVMSRYILEIISLFGYRDQLVSIMLFHVKYT